MLPDCNAHKLNPFVNGNQKLLHFLEGGREHREMSAGYPVSEGAENNMSVFSPVHVGVQLDEPE